jgi:hypothetical protein
MPTMRVADFAASTSLALAAAPPALLLCALSPSLNPVLATDPPPPCCCDCFCLLPKPRPLLGGVVAAAKGVKPLCRLRRAALHLQTRDPTRGWSTHAMLSCRRHTGHAVCEGCPTCAAEAGLSGSTAPSLREVSCAACPPMFFTGSGDLVHSLIWLASGLLFVVLFAYWCAPKLAPQPPRPTTTRPHGPRSHLCSSQGQVPGGQAVAVCETKAS